MTATDTIMVTVFGGSAGLSLTSISPVTGLQGTSVPITLTGVALHNVDAPSDVVLSGTGITVAGTPTVNPTGTEVTGLSFVVAPDAPTGARNVTVTTEDGTATANNAFTVNVNLVPAVTNVAPAFGRQGFSVPVTISGTNFGSVSSASNVVVSGTGVAVSGSPLISGDNTTITGLSFDVAADAPSGTQFRSVTVSTVGRGRRQDHGLPRPLPGRLGRKLRRRPGGHRGVHQQLVRGHQRRHFQHRRRS